MDKDDDILPDLLDSIDKKYRNTRSRKFAFSFILLFLIIGFYTSLNGIKIKSKKPEINPEVLENIQHQIDSIKKEQVDTNQTVN